MLCTRSVCLRQMARGDWAANMAFWRFVNNPQVTTDKLIEGWSSQTRSAVSGRHVLAIQDTSEVKFPTRPGCRRGLGKVGKGNARGLLLHAMMAVDADSGVCLGLTGGNVWTRKGKAKIPHEQRAVLQAAETLEQELAQAAVEPAQTSGRVVDQCVHGVPRKWRGWS